MSTPTDPVFISNLSVDLIKKLSVNKNIVGDIETRAQEIIDAENHQIELLTQLTRVQKAPEADSEPINSNSTTCTDSSARLLAKEKRKVQLRQKLQRLELLDEQLQEMLLRYDNTLSSLSTDTQILEREYKSKFTKLVGQSYQERIAEENHRCQEVCATKVKLEQQLLQLRERIAAIAELESAKVPIENASS